VSDKTSSSKSGDKLSHIKFFVDSGQVLLVHFVFFYSAFNTF
jgi:hypothetical protein